jgi:hypothetical protein
MKLTTNRKHLPSIVIGALVLLTNHAFSIAGVQPSGGLTERPMPTNGTVTIRWTNDLQAQQVHICLFNADDGSEAVVQSNIQAQQTSFVWTVPSNLAPGSKYRFVIRDASKPTRAMFSAGYVQLGNVPEPALTGVLDVEGDSELQIWPQPTDGLLNIRWKHSGVRTIVLLNMQGGIVYSTTVAANQQEFVLPLQDVASGSYILRLMNKERVVSQELVAVSK